MLLVVDVVRILACLPPRAASRPVVPARRGSAHLTDEVKGIVRDAGYDSSTTSLTGSVQAGDDLLALKRIGIYNRHGAMPEFTLGIERGKLQA